MNNKYNETSKGDSDQIRRELLSYKGLCVGGCGRRISSSATLMVYIDKESTNVSDESVFYYMVCHKCLKNMNKDVDVKNTVKNIESILNGNNKPYACLMYVKNINDSGNNFVNPVSSKIKVNKLNVNSPWVLDDIDFFEKNPERRFRYRKLFDGEIDDIETLKNDSKSYSLNTRFVIIHKVTEHQRLKAFLGGDVDEIDLMDELYINALFIVMTLNLESDKVSDVYKSLVEKNEIWSDFETFKFNYNS